jgi:uncharacterized protein YyaL (SSP411 family)
MSVFLTPEGKPFYGGTISPPVRRYNMASFGRSCGGKRAWENDREKSSCLPDKLRSTSKESASGHGYRSFEAGTPGPGSVRPGAGL